MIDCGGLARHCDSLIGRTETLCSMFFFGVPIACSISSLATGTTSVIARPLY